MDFQQIQELIKLIDNSNIGKITIKNGDFKINIVNKNYNNNPPTITYAAPTLPPTTTPTQTTPLTTPATTPTIPPPAELPNNLITIRSPMVGTFYRSSSPDKDAFVKIGDSISQGTVLCIIEAMKLFNEIQAETSGTIVKILIDNNQPVEYDQPLFLVKPN